LIAEYQSEAFMVTSFPGQPVKDACITPF